MSTSNLKRDLFFYTHPENKWKFHIVKICSIANQKVAIIYNLSFDILSPKDLFFSFK